MQTPTQETLDFTSSSRTFLSEIEKKQIGMILSAKRYHRELSEFQEIALSMSGEISIDDVRSRADELGIEYVPGNWLGSVFTNRQWRWTGKVKSSSHAGSHGRMIKIWVKREVA